MICPWKDCLLPKPARNFHVDTYSVPVNTQLGLSLYFITRIE